MAERFASVSEDELCEKCIIQQFIEFGFRMISWIIKTLCLCYLPKPKAEADNTDLGFDKFMISCSTLSNKKNEFIFYPATNLGILLGHLLCLSLSKLSRNWIWDTAINLKQNFKNLAVVLHVFQTTQNWSFHVVVLPRTAKKCTKIYNARAQLYIVLLFKPFV